MAAIHGALTALVERYRDIIDITINVVVPSRAASDPLHDAPLVENVMYLGASQHGVNGQRIIVKLPPPPRVIEALLPEVRAALDESLGQEELEASLYDDASELFGQISSNTAKGSLVALSRHQDNNDGNTHAHDDKDDDYAADDDNDDDADEPDEDDNDEDYVSDDDEDEDEDNVNGISNETDEALDALAAHGLPEPEANHHDADDQADDYDYYSDYSDTYAAYALSGDETNNKNVNNKDDNHGYPTEPYTQYEPDGEDAADVYRRTKRIRRGNND
jgi:hypothetical protein